MAIREWPAEKRPREKLLEHGASVLTDAELLAIFLRTGIRGLSAVDLAGQLLKEFGGLRPLLKADKDALCAAKGLGTAKYAQLNAVLEMARRHLQESVARGEALTDPQAARDYLRVSLGDLDHEVFASLFLDTRHRVICLEVMFRGTIDGASVHPREVVKRALHHNAAAVILVHNHPSGVAEPSRADEHITRRLREALSLVEVRVLDHLVVGDEVVSFAERGLI